MSIKGKAIEEIETMVVNFNSLLELLTMVDTEKVKDNTIFPAAMMVIAEYSWDL